MSPLWSVTNQIKEDITSPLSSVTNQKIKGAASRHHQLCGVIAGQGIKEDITSALWSVESGRHYVTAVQCGINEDVTSPLWSVRSSIPGMV